MRLPFLLLAFLLGALAMSDTATADEKKKPDTNKKESYDEKVTIREKAGQVFGNPVDDVPMFRWTIKDKDVMYVISSKAPKGSEITDAKGDVWTVTEAKQGGGNFRHTLCYVEKKK